MNPAYFPRIDISFSPAWWYHHYGMDFGDVQYWHNPILATERERDQRRLLFDRFGPAGPGEKDPAPRPIAGGEYGHRFMSAFWGCEIVYFTDQWPHAVPFSNPWSRMQTLKTPDVEESPAIQLLRKNARILEDHYGSCRGSVNIGGPMNNAVSVLGEPIFMACAAEKEIAQRVLYAMGDAVLRVQDVCEIEINHTAPGTPRSQPWGLGNCPIGQVSPQMYRTVILPVDLWLREQMAGPLDLHHCGLFQAYAEGYLPLRPATIDVGPGSDLRKTRKVFPDTPLSTYLEVNTVAGMDHSQVDTLLRQILTDAGPIQKIENIRIAEIGPDFTDAQVQHLLTASERF